MPSDGVNSTSTGCVYDTKSKGYGEGQGMPDTSFGKHTYNIDASRCSDVYSGTGNELNPLSLTCKFFIRY